MSKFYKFRQNNSGGSFVCDTARGISVEVWVEADDEASAIDRAESIGLYFDGCDSGEDCECCGDRWNTYLEEEDQAPTTTQAHTSTWVKAGVAHGYLHKLDGSIVALWEDGYLT